MWAYPWCRCMQEAARNSLPWFSQWNMTDDSVDCCLYRLMPGFHRSVAVSPFRCRSSVPYIATVAVARENGIGGKVFPLTPLTAFEQWPERWLAVQQRKNGKNRIRSYLLRNGGYGTTAAGTATAQQNFSRMQRNSYGAYGIFVTAMAERQRKGGNQA